MTTYIPGVDHRICVWLTVCAAYWLISICSARSICPDEVIEYRDKITVDGEVSDWVTVPFFVPSSDLADDSGLCILNRLAWNATSIFGLLRIKSNVDYEEIPFVDLFIDLRNIQTARMERYERGVAHLVIRLEEGHRAINARRDTGPNTSDKFGYVVCKRNSDVWLCEFAISWKAILPEFSPREGKWIGFATSVLFTEARNGRSNRAGAVSVESANPLEEAPISFSPMRLTQQSTEGSPSLFLKTDEVIIAGSPWLEIEAIVPADRVLDEKPELSVAIAGTRINRNLSLELKRHGQYYKTKELIPIADIFPKYDANKIQLECILTCGNRYRVRKEKTVLLWTSSKYHQIEAELPEEAISRLSTDTAALCHLLKECARESANLLAPAEEGQRAPQRRFRAVWDPTIYDEKIALFIRCAKRLICGELHPRAFPFTTFQSRDGFWIPVRIVYPWSYSKDIKYSANIHFYGKVRRRMRSDFMEASLIAMEANQNPRDFGDEFSIVPYDRWNSNEGFETETLSFIFDVLIHRLNVDSRQIRLLGNSAAADTALKIGARNPDLFATISGRAGGYASVSPKDMRLLDNLIGTNIILSAGQLDGTSDGTRLLVPELSKRGIKVRYEEIPNAKHRFTPIPLVRDAWQYRLPDIPREVAVVAFHPDFGRAFWLSIEGLNQWGEIARAKATLRSDVIYVETVNVSSFKIDRTQLMEPSSPKWICINGTAPIELDRGNRGQPYYENCGGGEWKESAGRRSPYFKARGLAGPASRLEGMPIAVIYGTQAPNFAGALKERALRVPKARVGVGDDQAAIANITILPDVEYRAEYLRGWNLWLIGGPRENRVTEYMMKLDPRIEELRIEKADHYQSGSLVSFVFPALASPGGYLFFELGAGPDAYRANIRVPSNADGIVQEGNAGVVVRTFDFDSRWILQE